MKLLPKLIDVITNPTWPTASDMKIVMLAHSLISIKFCMLNQTV